MPTTYPDQIDIYVDPTPLSTDPRDNPSLSGWVTNLHDAVLAVQQELGTHPSGASATVAERLGTYGTEISDAQADIVALQADVVTAQQNIQDNADAIGVLNGQVSGLQGDTGNNATSISDLQAKVGTGASLPTAQGAVLQSDGTGTAWDTQLRLIAGSAVEPTYSFLDDPDTGVMLVGVGQIGLVTGGVVRAMLSAAGTMIHGPADTATDEVIAATVVGDTFHRYSVDASGAIRWSTGIADTDANWGRLDPQVVGSLDTAVRAVRFGAGIAPAPGVGYRFLAGDTGDTGLAIQGVADHAAPLIDVIDDTSANVFSVGYGGVVVGVPSALQQTRVAGQFARAQVAVTDATAAYEADLAAGNNHDITLTQNCVLTVAGVVDGYENTLMLTVRQDATGGWTLTWPAGIQWEGGIAPTITAAAGSIDRFEITTHDDGVTFFGRVLGQNYQ